MSKLIQLIKFLKSCYRKVYVYYIFSTRKNWHISKNKNYYNPTYKATVYWYSGFGRNSEIKEGWSIARFGVYYNGYKSREIAQEQAFKMWMRQR
ncbi:MAG: hypothetical protein COA94_03415 [Rickettsiales bacterium]|nr:MAG: hypothetical protein COA94_03415 [Rickettsiales bacterium]